MHTILTLGALFHRAALFQTRIFIECVPVSFESRTLEVDEQMQKEKKEGLEGEVLMGMGFCY